MIPWQEFEPSRSCWNVEFPVCLHEEHLYFIQDGPTMADYVFNSPMLELAHERQFVVSQQGGDSADFACEHTKRILSCIDVLDRHFHESDGDRVLESIPTPPSVDSVGLWMVAQSLESPDAVSPDLPHEWNSRFDDLADDLSSPMLRSTIHPRVLSIPQRIMEDVEFSDDQLDDMVRSFIADECHPNGRYQQGRGYRAKKPIKQRRRLPDKDRYETDQIKTVAEAAQPEPIGQTSIACSSLFHNRPTLESIQYSSAMEAQHAYTVRQGPISVLADQT